MSRNTANTRRYGWLPDMPDNLDHLCATPTSHLAKFADNPGKKCYPVTVLYKTAQYQHVAQVLNQMKAASPPAILELLALAKTFYSGAYMKNFYGLMKHFYGLPLLLLLGGCPTATIPEIKPFADKTAEMVITLNKGYAQTEASLIDAADGTAAKKLQTSWEPTKKALSAVVAYSDSLAAIADAGNKGNDSAKAVGTSLNGLIAAVNPLLPGLSDQLVNAIGAISSYIAKIKARESMANAVEEAQPAINTIADVISKNFDDLALIYAAAGSEQERALFEPSQELYNYHRSLNRQRQIVTTTLTSILDYQNASDAAAKKDALEYAMKQDAPLTEAVQRAGQCQEARAKRSPADHLAACKDVPDIVEDRQNKLLVKWRSLQAELDRIAPEYNAYATKEAALKEQISNGKVLIKKSKEAILSWRDTHAQIKGALEQKQRITIQELATVIKDMADVYKKGDK